MSETHDIEPHLKHDIVLPGGQVVHVSSVYYQLPAGDVVNETCVFYPNGTSEVRGNYHDHDRVVAEFTSVR